MATKNSKRPVIVKRTFSVKIFFSGEGVAIHVPVKKDKNVTGKYYKDLVLKKKKKKKKKNTYYQKWHPVMVFKHVQTLYDNVPAH